LINQEDTIALSTSKENMDKFKVNKLIKNTNPNKLMAALGMLNCYESEGDLEDQGIDMKQL